MNKLIALVAVGVLAILGVPAYAQEDTDCSRVSGRYSLSPVDLANCPGGTVACYAGTITGVGIRYGQVLVAISSRAQFAGLPPTAGALASYGGVTTITTKQGTLTLRNVGLFALSQAILSFVPPLSLFQTDTAIVTSGDGRFSGASGHLISVGVATATSLSPPAFEGLNGDVSGEICVAQ